IHAEVLTAEWNDLQLADRERYAWHQRPNRETHLVHDLHCGGRGMSRNEYRYSPVEPRQRRYVEMVVMFMAEDHRVHRGESLGREYSPWVNAVFESMHRSELLAQERNHEHARGSAPHHPSFIAE